MKVQIIIGFCKETMVKVNKKLYEGGIQWPSKTSNIYYRQNEPMRYINFNGHNRISGVMNTNFENFKSTLQEIFSDSQDNEKRFEYISAVNFLTNPKIIDGWEKKTYKISIEGKEVELSKKSFENIKKAIKEIE